MAFGHSVPFGWSIVWCSFSSGLVAMRQPFGRKLRWHCSFHFKIATSLPKTMLNTISRNLKEKAKFVPHTELLITPLLNFFLTWYPRWYKIHPNYSLNEQQKINILDFQTQKMKNQILLNKAHSLKIWNHHMHLSLINKLIFQIKYFIAFPTNTSICTLIYFYICTAFL